MAIFDDEPKKKPRPHEIGQDLSLLSVDELSERIALLREEIVRLEAERAAKGPARQPARAQVDLHRSQPDQPGKIPALSSPHASDRSLDAATASPKMAGD